ncbi:MAG: hypothetical protein K6T30_08675 [Alicyclobacillus sp.]|nr:hypothetical protein [Alicyclobacillus sp.]
MGDAESTAEADLLASGQDLAAEVLKVGHHGSTSSTSATFLRSVDPDYAVISVGAGNTYGHPKAETLTALTEAGAQVFRTDLQGTIVATATRSLVLFNVEPHQVSTSSGSGTTQDITVYVTNTGTKYHREGCRYLSQSCIPISLADAKARGYTPCSVCNPPR